MVRETLGFITWCYMALCMVLASHSQKNFDVFCEVSMCMVLVGHRFCDRYDQQGLLPPIIVGNRYVYIPNSMFHVSFWCVAFPVSIPEKK